MRASVTGPTGLIGGVLARKPRARDGQVVALVRSRRKATTAVGIPVSQRSEMFEVNVRRTERDLDAAIGAGVARIVYVSTMPAAA